MIQVNVTLVGASTVGFSSQFPDQATADAWIAQCESSNVWGKPARTLTANEQGIVLDIDGTTPNLALAASTGTAADGFGNTVNTYTFNADYTVASADITAQIAIQAAVQKGILAQNFGAQVVAMVYAYNDINITSGALTSATFNALLLDVTVSNIERLLWNGALATALAQIQGYAYLTTYFSALQISAIESAITTYIGML